MCGFCRFFIGAHVLMTFEVAVTACGQFSSWIGMLVKKGRQQFKCRLVLFARLAVPLALTAQTPNMLFSSAFIRGGASGLHQRRRTRYFLDSWLVQIGRSITCCNGVTIDTRNRGLMAGTQFHMSQENAVPGSALKARITQ